MLMLKLLFLDLKKSKFGSLFIIFLIACSVALSIAVSISERAFAKAVPMQQKNSILLLAHRAVKFSWH
ncbi:hypothetical protein [Gallibacterium anatis]|uniref:hypothetical protein n=1 Tax=Gallibacterium anatis TaxID=750 RepID=UPI000A77F11F|nr:hypothetical protein [Gallibacterium anatis]